jgi:predicted amidohydrolase
VCFRYRKFNLFGEPGFNTTQEPEFSVFDTDFGVKFGMFTCFDILFEKPAISLVRVLGVTDIVYPTAWFSELPFHSGKLWVSVLAVCFVCLFLFVKLGNLPSAGL